MIPQVFHQVWVGPEPLPEEYRRYGQTWLDHNSGWELRVWTDENLPPDLERKEVYELLRQPAERSDMLIFELLYRFGGVYVDTDFECLRPIEPLLEGVEIFCSYSHSDRLNNAIMGSVPRHPLIEQGLRELRPRTTYGTVDKAGTGPFFVTELLRRAARGEALRLAALLPAHARGGEGPPTASTTRGGAGRTPPTWSRTRMRAEHRLAIAQDELAALRREHELALAELEALRGGPSARALALRTGRRAVPRGLAARSGGALRRRKPPVQ